MFNPKSTKHPFAGHMRMDRGIIFWIEEEEDA